MQLISQVLCFLPSTTAPASISVNQGVIGARNDAQGTDYFNGIIDEVRDSDGFCRSASWIKASYNSENNTLQTIGNIEIFGNAIFFGMNF